ncbi:sensor histidine kinase [Vallitalea pronyensis]|uniref:Sensor histidine kinase n=1 Tax=Vallitalea pronyensis TaxID=1348613 RepID=A0A8J8SI27_9FIRM|nr:sensor histidine kinase [Vallitalea pronyensis]QUI24460.1 sensor histidine kinase [Vallitalea pronyensis]
MGLRKKFFLLVILVVIIPSVVMGIMSYLLTKQILKEKYEVLIRENTVYIAGIIDHEYIQVESISDYFFSNEWVIKKITNSNLFEDHYERIRTDQRLTQVFNSFITFNIFNAFEVFYMSGYYGDDFWYRIGSDFVSKKAIHERVGDFRDDRIRKLTYKGIQTSLDQTLAGQQVLAYNRILVDKDYENIGFLYFEIDPSYFGNMLKNNTKVSDTVFTLLDDQYNIIYSYDESLIGKPYHDDTLGPIHVNIALNNGWHLISDSSTVNINAEYKAFFYIIILTTLCTFLLSSTILWFITKKVVGPIKQLVETMDKAVSSDSLEMVYYYSHDEIGRLTDSFNKMTVRVRESREKEIQKDKTIKELDYKALQSQINPHFLYNTLNTISWMAQMQKAYTIKDMIDQLWKMLRKVSKGSEISNLKDEVELIQSFCKIQQIKYNGKFELQLDIDEKYYGTSCPKFILQPIVENAIFHGIEPKKGTGVIIISVSGHDNMMTIEISDNGIGMSAKQVKEVLDKSHHIYGKKGFNNIGIINVHERLQLLYGKKYGLSIESTVDEGTTVVIRIPMNYPLNEGGEHV